MKQKMKKTTATKPKSWIERTSRLSTMEVRLTNSCKPMTKARLVSWKVMIDWVIKLGSIRLKAIGIRI